MLWTTIAVLVGLSLLALQLQLANERRWELSRWLSGSIAVWFANAVFATYIFEHFTEMTFAVGKTSLVGSAILNVIILGLALGARRLSREVDPGPFGTSEMLWSAVSGVSFIGGAITIATLWT